MEVQLPQYQCHKKVRAGKIGTINPRAEGGATLDLITPVESSRGSLSFFSVDVSDKWLARFKPEIDGYFVQYDDGYQSFSTAKAFEEGYTLIK